MSKINNVISSFVVRSITKPLPSTTTTTTTTQSSLINNQSLEKTSIEEKDKFCLDEHERNLILELPEFFLYQINEINGGKKGGELFKVVGQLSSGKNTASKFAHMSKHTSSASNSDKLAFGQTLSSIKTPKKEYVIADLPPIIPGLFDQVEVTGCKPTKFNSQSNYGDTPSLFTKTYRLLHSQETLNQLKPLELLDPDDPKFSETPSHDNRQLPFKDIYLLCLQVYRIPGTPVNNPQYDTVVLNKIAHAITKGSDASSQALTVFQIAYIKQCLTTPPSQFEVDYKLKDVMISRHLFDDCIENQLKPSKIGQMFFRNANVKMYFHTREWNLLSRYYPYDILGPGLSREQFLELYRVITRMPMVLCFRRQIHIEYDVEMTVTDENTGDEDEIIVHRKLPELEMEHLMDLQSINKDLQSINKDLQSINKDLQSINKDLQSINKDLQKESPESFKEEGDNPQVQFKVADLAKMCLYSAMKRAKENEKHTFLPYSQLFISARKICKEYDLPDQIVNGADWMGLVTEMSTNEQVFATRRSGGEVMVYLYEDYKYENILASIVSRLVRRSLAISGEETCIREDVLNNLELIKTFRSNRGHLLCDEQQKALLSFIQNAVTVVNGPAGSGKTDFLQSLYNVIKRTSLDDVNGFLEFLTSSVLYFGESSASVISSEKERLSKELTSCSSSILATSVQGNNAADLNKLFSGSGSTTHKLLLNHYRNCPNHGLRSKDNFTINKSFTLNKKKSNNDDEDLSTARCPFYSIRVVIIEEGSLYTPELAAKICAIMSLCAPRFEKILIVGDVNQLASVSAGNFLKDMTTAASSEEAKEAGGISTIYFSHDHRTDPNAKILKHNNDAIRDNRFEDIIFDGISAIHKDICYQSNSNGTSLQNYEMKNILLELIKEYNLTVYNNHFITRTNENRQILDTVCRQYYYESVGRPLAQYRSYGFYKGFKITFKKNTESIVSGRIYIILEIFDLNVASNGNITRYASTSKSKYQKLEPKREIQYVNHTSDRQNDWQQFKRYMVLYEVSSFSSAFTHDNPTTQSNNITKQLDEQPVLTHLEDLIEKERQRFFKSLEREGLGDDEETTTTTTSNSSKQKMIFGKSSYPNIRDPRSIFVVVKCMKDTLDNMQSSHATTVNKVQGSQGETMVDFLLTGSIYETRPSIYTAATRAQKRFIFVGNKRNLKEAIARDEPPRNSSLASAIERELFMIN